MALPEGYLQNFSSVPAYFQAIREAKAPERFTQKFLESLDFKSTNDRLFIRVLKDLSFLDTDGVPTQRYFNFLDETQSGKILAEAIEETYEDLFNVKQNAQTLENGEIQSKLATLFQGKKSKPVLYRMANTFKALCDVADFSKPTSNQKEQNVASEPTPLKKIDKTSEENKSEPANFQHKSKVNVDTLQYHINIVLPESRDQAVYDAIFKSLREHLG